jgi:hypothetical protein
VQGDAGREKGEAVTERAWKRRGGGEARRGEAGRGEAGSKEGKTAPPQLDPATHLKSSHPHSHTPNWPAHTPRKISVTTRD